MELGCPSSTSTTIRYTLPVAPSARRLNDVVRDEVPDVLGIALADAARHAGEGLASLRQRHLPADELAVRREDVGIQVPFFRAGVQPVGIPDRELLDLDDVQRAQRGGRAALLPGIAMSREHAEAQSDANSVLAMRISLGGRA